MNLRTANQASQRGVQLINGLSSFRGAVALAILVRLCIHIVGKSCAWIYSKQTRCCSVSSYFDLQQRLGKKNFPFQDDKKKGDQNTSDRCVILLISKESIAGCTLGFQVTWH